MYLAQTRRVLSEGLGDETLFFFVVVVFTLSGSFSSVATFCVPLL